MKVFILKFLAAGLLVTGLSYRVQSQDSITIGCTDHLHSSVLNEDRTLWIHIPSGSTNPGQPRPVVYLLDADINFRYFAGISSFLSHGTRNQIPEPIIIGIINTNRTRDLTPTKASVANPGKEGRKLFTESGGGDAFFRFMQTELKPYINRKYQQGGRQILIGHSFGGLAVIDCLLHHPDYFDDYIANDPSLWWDELYEVKEAEKQWKTPGNQWSDKKLYLSHSGAKVGAGHFGANGAEANGAFSKQLQKAPAGFLWQEKTYTNETHGTISLMSNIDAWRFLSQ